MLMGKSEICSIIQQNYLRAVNVMIRFMQDYAIKFALQYKLSAWLAISVLNLARKDLPSISFSRRQADFLNSLTLVRFVGYFFQTNLWLIISYCGQD